MGLVTFWRQVETQKLHALAAVAMLLWTFFLKVSEAASITGRELRQDTRTEGVGVLKRLIAWGVFEPPLF